MIPIMGSTKFAMFSLLSVGLLLDFTSCQIILPSVRQNFILGNADYLDSLYEGKGRFFRKHVSNSNTGYSYEGSPETHGWTGECLGRKQSPINIVTHDAKPVTRKPLSFMNGLPSMKTDITYRGETILVRIDDKNKLKITGGILEENVYVFQQMHWHWGANSSGSEHTINSKRYALEQHSVFYKEDSEDPADESDGIVVIAQLYEVGKRDNPDLQFVLRLVASGSVKPGKTVTIKGISPLYSLFPQTEEPHSYWSYMGSLTSPPCSENVRWIVFPKKRRISTRQLRQFRKLKDAKGIRVTHNFRATQPLNGREVYIVNS